MRRTNRLTKAQGFIEYAVVIAVVAAALVAGKIFFTRALMEKHRQGADILGQGEQYASGVTTEIDLDDPGTDYGSLIAPQPEVDCDEVNRRVSNLENEIAGLRSQANTLEQSANGTGIIFGGTSEGQDTMREQARILREQADAKEAEAAQYRTDYPNCF